MRHRNEYEDDEPKTVHVPLTMMDAMQRDVAATFGDIEHLRRLRDEAMAARELADTTAWRGDASKKVCPSCGFDLTSADLTRAGNGNETDDAANPHSKHFDLDSAKAARNAAFEAYNREQENAWRGGRY